MLGAKVLYRWGPIGLPPHHLPLNIGTQMRISYRLKSLRASYNRRRSGRPAKRSPLRRGRNGRSHFHEARYEKTGPIWKAPAKLGCRVGKLDAHGESRYPAPDGYAKEIPPSLFRQREAGSDGEEPRSGQFPGHLPRERTGTLRGGRASVKSAGDQHRDAGGIRTVNPDCEKAHLS
jgi:hypothetical protein